jgi:acyl-coenzyme A thioesterase PaaI-like protein
MPPGARVLTVELKINLLAPAEGDRLRATGRVERAGRTLTVVRGEVDVLTGDEAVAVALMQGTMICLLPPDR